MDDLLNPTKTFEIKLSIHALTSMSAYLIINLIRGSSQYVVKHMNISQSFEPVRLRIRI